MTKVLLLDGSYEFINNEQQIQRLIAEKLGNDVGEQIEQLIENANYVKQKINTDLESYESSLEEWNCVGNDILDIIDNLKSYISDSKRIDRYKLSNSLERIEREINNIM